VHFRTLGEPGALEAAINWYRANNIASAAIPPVSVPTLYIWGTADASVGRRAAELTEQFVSGPYRFVEIEGGGHFIVDQFPDYIAQLLIEPCTQHFLLNPFGQFKAATRMHRTSALPLTARRRSNE
jgi:pimeloyl-ACP methyl ester carboxylesterase